jgi:anti-sigma-K factor RskA
MGGNKPHMHTQGVDEPLLVNYLLGKLTEEEQVRIEDRAFADREYLSAIDAAEADLIDAYVSGDLPQADRRAFEEHFLTSPQRRGKVEFAQALARVAAESARAAAPAARTATGWLAFLNPIRTWNPALRYAGAMGAVVCFAGGAWLIGENASMRSRVATLESQQHELELGKQAVEQALRQAQTRPGSNPAPQAAPRIPLVASLALMAGPTRSETRMEQLVIDRGVQLAHIEILLEPRDEFARFRADLRTRAGKDILTLSDLPRRRSGNGFSVAMDVPSSVLSSGDYELALKGLRDGETAQELGYYYFRVQKR